MQLSTVKEVDMYFQESFGFCLSVNESQLNFVFPGQEFFVTLDHPERVLQFYEQVSDWTTYRVTTRMTTKISNSVEKCKNTNTDFKTLMEEYEEYQNCLLNHTFNVKNILMLGYLFPVTDYFPQGGLKTIIEIIFKLEPLGKGCHSNILFINTFFPRFYFF